MPISEHPVVAPGAVPVNTLAEEIIDPADQGVVVHVAGGSTTVSGTVTTTDTAAEGSLATLVGAAPAVGAAASLWASHTLPASGVMETAPSGAVGVAVPTGTVTNPTRKAMVSVSYTQGGSGGYMALYLWGLDGTGGLWAVMPSPLDQSGNPYAIGPTGGGSFAEEVAFDITGQTAVYMTAQEVGNTGSPGTYLARVVFK